MSTGDASLSPDESGLVRKSEVLAGNLLSQRTDCHQFITVICFMLPGHQFTHSKRLKLGGRGHLLLDCIDFQFVTDKLWLHPLTLLSIPE